MKKFYDIILSITGILFLIIIFATLSGVFFRFVLNDPLTWTDELSRFSLLWMVFLASAVVSFKDKHLVVDFIFDYTNDFWNRILKGFSFILSLIFLVVVIFTSFELIRVAGYAKSPALEIPLSYWRASVVVGFILMIFAMIYTKIKQLKNWREE